MKFFPTRTTFLQIGSLSIQWYAVLILTGALIAYIFAKRNLKEYRNIDVNDFFDDVFITLLWTGIVGARLWYCIFNDFSYYFSNPVNILKVWEGGLAFHGGFICAIIAVILLCKKRNVSFIKVADSVVPTVLIGQAFGRWGNYINKECHGPAVSADYFDGVLSFLKEGMCINGIYYMPLFFYESMLCLLGFILINFVLRKQAKKRGELTGAYLMWYGVVRFIIEGFRTDSLMIGPLKTAQIISILFFVAGVLLYLGMYDKLFKPRKPTIVFDLDGTIINSTPAILGSFRAVFEKFGKLEDFTPDKQIEVLGPPIKEMFAKYFPDQDIEAINECYQEANRRLIDETLVPMPNAFDTLVKLKAETYRLAILTTRNREGTIRCLRRCGIDEELFDSIVGIDDVTKTKPDPEGMFKVINSKKLNSADVVMIGDSVADMEVGKNYGAYTIAYISNEGKKEQVLSTNPNRSINDLNEIFDILKEKHYFTYNEK